MPVNLIDPSGNVSIAGVGSSLNIVGNLYTAASIGFQVYTGNYAGAGKELAEEVVYSKFGGAFGKRVVNFSQQQVGLLFRTFNRQLGKPLRLGRKANSGTLTHNLEALGVTKPTGTQAHHIVGGATPAGLRTRARLDALGIDQNSPMNGVFLPGCKKSNAIGLIHCGKHTGEYEAIVEEIVLSAGNDKAAVINALSDVRRGLLDGTFTPLNARSISR